LPRLIACLMAVSLHVGAPAAGVLAFAFAEAELPPEAIRRTICIFPMPGEHFNILSLAQGATEPEVDALFGVRTRTTLTTHTERDWCARYQYSPSLSYTLLFRHGAVKAMWLTEGAFVPDACGGIVVKTESIPQRSWYPSEAPHYTWSRGSADPFGAP
jgi:hypothetical protein